MWFQKPDCRSFTSNSWICPGSIWLQYSSLFKTVQSTKQHAYQHTQISKSAHSLVPSKSLFSLQVALLFISLHNPGLLVPPPALLCGFKDRFLSWCHKEMPRFSICCVINHVSAQGIWLCWNQIVIITPSPLDDFIKVETSLEIVKTGNTDQIMSPSLNILTFQL